MKKAKFYNELTRDRSLLYIIEYENTHPIIINRIESVIMEGVKNSQYITSLDFDLQLISSYDIKMIPKVLHYYGFDAEWGDNIETSKTGTLTIHWA